MNFKILYSFIYLFICLNGYTQINLVPNYSFEDTLGPCKSQMGISTLFASFKDWHTCTSSTTPDYYNTCANAIIYPNICTVPYSSRSYQNPHIGNAYIGLGTYYVLNPADSAQIEVEYIATKLKAPLKPNVCYYSEFYVCLSNISKLTTNQISLLLTQNTFTTATGSFTNTIQPQIQWDTTQFLTDTLNWVKISGYFMAQGGEEHLTIGNFKDGNHLKKTTVNSNFTSAFGAMSGYFFTYILIDDVSLYELPTPQLQSNAITICPNSDSLLLGDTTRIQSTYKWYANNILIANTSTISVKPNQTTTYVLQTTQCNTTTQTVIVTYSANCEPIVVVEPIIPNVFTPNDDSINDVWRFSLGKGNLLQGISIYNRWGNLIWETSRASVTQINWDGRTTSGEPTPSGVYFYVLQYTDVNGDEHKKNGYITLIR